MIAKYGEVTGFLQSSPFYSEKALRNWSNINIADPWSVAVPSALGYAGIEISVGIIIWEEVGASV